MPGPSTHMVLTEGGPLLKQCDGVFVLKQFAVSVCFPNVDADTVTAARATILARGIQLPEGYFHALLKRYLKLSRAEKIALRQIPDANPRPREMALSYYTQQSNAAMPLSTAQEHTPNPYQEVGTILESSNAGMFSFQEPPPMSPMDETTPLLGNSNKTIQIVVPEVSVADVSLFSADEDMLFSDTLDGDNAFLSSGTATAPGFDEVDQQKWNFQLGVIDPRLQNIQKLQGSHETIGKSPLPRITIDHTDHLQTDCNISAIATGIDQAVAGQQSRRLAPLNASLQLSAAAGQRRTSSSSNGSFDAAFSVPLSVLKDRRLQVARSISNAAEAARETASASLDKTSLMVDQYKPLASLPHRLERESYDFDGKPIRWAYEHISHQEGGQ